LPSPLTPRYPQAPFLSLFALFALLYSSKLIFTCAILLPLFSYTFTPFFCALFIFFNISQAMTGPPTLYWQGKNKKCSVIS
jgi:hypothetical protein